MDERSVVSERLSKKMQEVQSLEERLRAARIYVQALQDVMKALGGPAPEPRFERAMRSGSTVSQARDLILKEGAPLHLAALLRGMGKEDTRESRASLTSSLAAYVRRGDIFTRPAPNTYGLAELSHREVEEPEPEPPCDFGFSPLGGADSDDDEIPF